MKRLRHLLFLSGIAWGVRLVRTQDCASASVDSIRVEDPEDIFTLSQAINCSSSGQVEAIWVGSVTLSTTLVIGAEVSLNVTGESDAVAVGSSSGPMFHVLPNGALYIYHLTLSGGTAEAGGAILSELGTVKIEDCELLNNTATSGGGGAISAIGGDVTIASSHLHGNNASGNGGAVQAIDVNFTAQQSVCFEDNSAEEGGAVFCGGSNASSTSQTSSCTFQDATFLQNNASQTDDIEVTDFIPPWKTLWGGGGVSLVNTTAVFEECSFHLNHAQVSGGGLYSGADSEVTMDECTFSNNTAQGYGGAATISSATITGSTLFENNTAGRYGAAVFAWDNGGHVDIESFRCLDNMANENGGCFYSAAAKSEFRDEVFMSGNVGGSGGCIYAATYSTVRVLGGTYTCKAVDNGGFLFASNNATVSIEGGLVTGCLALRRAGVAYCKGGSDGEDDGSKVTISGGMFVDNEALELGGCVMAWGTVVNISGGQFVNNTARYYGGFIFLEEEASVVCEGATIQGNYAGDQGGGVYARDAPNVSLTGCDLLANESPQGPAAYLTHVDLAIFESSSVKGNVAVSGSAVFIAQSNVVMREVAFGAANASAVDPTNRALQSDSGSSFHGDRCSFEGWVGDLVISHGGIKDGSLILNDCDFRYSSAGMVVSSPNSYAEIRNSRVSSFTLSNAGDPLLLADNALSCNSPDACGAGDCVNSSLGVLCECLPVQFGGACLDDGPTLNLTVESVPGNDVFSPDAVGYELLVSADAMGSTTTIWDLKFESDRLELEVVPFSGILSPGEASAVTVSGTLASGDAGGVANTAFVLITVPTGTNSSAATFEVRVISDIYLCGDFEVAYALNATSLACEQCTSLIEGDDGVDCSGVGVTLGSLPIRDGHWRSDNESFKVHSCDYSRACKGGLNITSSDDYCADGYRGPYCAVCAEGYGRGVGNQCHECTGTRANLLIALGAIFCLLGLCFLVLVAIFLIGGLAALDSLRDSIASNMTTFKRSRERRRPRRSTAVGEVRFAAGDGRRPFGSGHVPVHAVSTRSAGASRAEVISTDSGGVTDRETLQTAGQTADSGTVATPASGVEVRRQLGSTGFIAWGGAGARPRLLTRGDRWRSGPRRREGLFAGTVDPGEERPESPERSSRCCCREGVLKRLMSRLPLDKLKILVVVWQILTIFPAIAAVEFPPVYALFLSWVDVVNLDLGHIFSASCLVRGVTHYERLLAATLGPLLLGLGLACTYRMAIRRAGIGRAGIMARRAAWSRHMAAGLLLTFLVFTSTSTAIFRTFPCDDRAVDQKSFLRADYSVLCYTPKHTIYRIYAGLMILVYPIGIPLLYFSILLSNREALNPKLRQTTPSPDESVEDSVRDVDECGKVVRDDHRRTLSERIRQRKENPDLVPSIFLWKDFGPDMYYYEVIECGRRILLTGGLIFISPQTSTQAAMACIFAFGSLLGFELLRPHLDPTDSWLYRLGCIVIFLSNFLALLIKTDAAGDGRQNALGTFMVVINVILIVAVIITSWFATQQSVDESREGDTSLALARRMMTTDRLALSSTGRRNLRIMTPSSSGRLMMTIGMVTPSTGRRPVISDSPAPLRGLQFVASSRYLSLERSNSDGPSESPGESRLARAHVT